MESMEFLVYGFDRFYGVYGVYGESMESLWIYQLGIPLITRNLTYNHGTI